MQSLDLLELAAFAQVCSGSICDYLNIQIWHPNHDSTFVLSSSADAESEEDAKPDMSAYHMMLVKLPKSGKVVWLPLIPHAHSTPEFMLAQWKSRLYKIDTRMLVTPKQKPNSQAGRPPDKPARVSAIAGRVRPNTRSAAKAGQGGNQCPDSKRKAARNQSAPQRRHRQEQN